MSDAFVLIDGYFSGARMTLMDRFVDAGLFCCMDLRFCWFMKPRPCDPFLMLGIGDNNYSTFAQNGTTFPVLLT
jgi:hypothetical protein